MRRITAVAALGFGLAACSDVPVAPNATRTPTQASFSRSGGIPIPGQYIVRFRDDEQNVDAQATSLASTNAGEVTRVYKTAIKGMAIRIPDAAVAMLRADSRVISIEQDQTVSISTTQTGVTWGIDRIDQRALPLNGTYVYNADGSGVTVYIIDTGINFTHTEYNGRAFTGIDEVTAGGTAADCNGHGSHVSGTVGGTIYGVAKKVKLVAVRVLDCSGSGTVSGVIAGIDWVTAQKKATPSVPSAANMSLGGGLSTTLNQAVDNSSAAGVVYAIAAGNSTADACTFSPASAPSAIAVGATDINDGFAYFSNYGSCVAINAPGVDITSAWIGTNTATNTISGTSMATPHVAGTAGALPPSQSDGDPGTGA
jgi:subtilisin family serine protease